MVKRELSGGRLIAQDLRSLGIVDEKVLRSFSLVPRAEFLATSLGSRARDNDALPIGHGQTTSQPWVIARMLELAKLDGTGRCLEVGTGCGYQTALLTHLAKEVFSVERIGTLLADARRRLRELGYTSPRLAHRDGMKGLPEGAPFDTIIVCAATAAPPPPLLEQLAPSGRLVLPQNHEDHETLTVYERQGSSSSHEQVMFVPLIEGVS